MATIRDSVLQPIQVFEPNPRERALDALRAKLGREPTAGDIHREVLREIEENPLRVVTATDDISPEQRADFREALAALGEDAVFVLPPEATIEVVTLPGKIPAGFPIAVSISADPTVKATTKANSQ